MTDETNEHEAAARELWDRVVGAGAPSANGGPPPRATTEEQPPPSVEPEAEQRPSDDAGAEHGDRTAGGDTSGDEFPTDDFERRLRMDNLTPTMIDTAKQLPLEERRAMYDAIKKRHDRIDRVFHERNRMERPRPEPEQEDPPAEKPPKAPSLREKLGDKVDLIGDDVVEALEAYVDEREQRLRSEIPPARQQPDQQQVEQMRAVAAEVEANRARLAEVYPSARLDGAEWDRIVQKVNAEAGNPYYSRRYQDDWPGAMRAVFDRVMDDEGYVQGSTYPQANGRGTTTRSGPVTRNSAASASAQKGPPEQVSKKEAARIMWDHIQKHPRDIDGARRAAGLKPLDLHPAQIVRPGR